MLGGWSGTASVTLAAAAQAATAATTWGMGRGPGRAGHTASAPRAARCSPRVVESTREAVTTCRPDQPLERGRRFAGELEDIHVDRLCQLVGVGIGVQETRPFEAAGSGEDVVLDQRRRRGKVVATEQLFHRGLRQRDMLVGGLDDRHLVDVPAGVVTPLEPGAGQ